MKCPDLDRLIDVVNGVRPDAELEAHLRVCPSCRADLDLLREIPAALRPEIEVPEELVRRVVTDLALEGATPESRRGAITQVAASAVLGMLTAGAALVASGSAGAGNPAGALLFSVVVGLGAGALQIRRGRSADVKRP